MGHRELDQLEALVTRLEELLDLRTKVAELEAEVRHCQERALNPPSGSPPTTIVVNCTENALCEHTLNRMEELGLCGLGEGGDAP